MLKVLNYENDSDTVIVCDHCNKVISRISPGKVYQAKNAPTVSQPLMLHDHCLSHYETIHSIELKKTQMSFLVGQTTGLGGPAVWPAIIDINIGPETHQITKMFKSLKETQRKNILDTMAAILDSHDNALLESCV